jgi:hypothetical protein
MGLLPSCMYDCQKFPTAERMQGCCKDCCIAKCKPLQLPSQAEAQSPGEAASSSSASSSSSFLMQLLPGGRIVEAVQLAPSSSSSSTQHSGQLTAAMPSRFCGVHVSTDGGAVSVGQVQEADMQLVTRGGTVAVKRCKANHAAINTAREPQQAGQGGNMQVTGQGVMAVGCVVWQLGVTVMQWHGMS